MEKIVLYGASGHGKVIKEIVEANGDVVSSFIDDNTNVDEMAGIKVSHSHNTDERVIVSIGLNHIRKMIVERSQYRYGVAIHPTAVVSPSARIGEGTVVMAGAIINADAVIGKHCIVNTSACIDHECVVGDYCHIAPHSTLCGQVHVGEGTLMGVGSCAIPCTQVGSWCVIGAGAAVVSDVPDGTTAVGVPAKPIKSKE